MTEGVLTGYRVLELSEEENYMCGKIFGDMGADVITIEPPGGDRGRRLGPFRDGRSLSWVALNTSKRGITLDIDRVDGRALFMRLAGSADFIIQSLPSSRLSSLGLGYEALSAVNPRVIVVSITPFGQSGPYSEFRTSDLVSMSMGGLVFITGDRDREPVGMSIPQAYQLAGVHAAAESLIAHYYRQQTGEGQVVDVSIQAAVARVLFMEPLFWDFEKFLIRRQGHQISRARLTQTEVWDCKDGLVYFRIFGGAYGRRNEGLVDWMKEEGAAGALGAIKDWGAVNLALVSQEESDDWERLIGDFFRKHTRKEIHREAIRRNITALAACNDFSDTVEDEHLICRDFWVEVESPEAGSAIRHTGPPYRLSLTPWRASRPAPGIGQHNAEVFCDELCLSRRELDLLVQGGIV